MTAWLNRRKKVIHTQEYLDRFELFWLKDMEDYQGVVSSRWGLDNARVEFDPFFDIGVQLEGCKEALMGWSKKKFGR